MVVDIAMNSMNKFTAADGKREDEKIESCSPEHGHCAENVVKKKMLIFIAATEIGTRLSVATYMRFV